MLYAPPCLNPTKSSGNCVARDVARGYDATDLAGEGRGRQDDPPIDCCVWGVFFSPYFALGWKRLTHAPPCSNKTKSSGHRVSHDVARSSDATDRAGEGRGRLDGRPIDC
jgi:hypothetical protein